MDSVSEKWFGLRTFREGSILQFYLGTKQPTEKFLVFKSTTLKKTYDSLRDIIQREKLVDPHNSHLIIADSGLELALEVRLLHVSQLSEYIENQLVHRSFDAIRQKATAPAPELLIPVTAARMITFGDDMHSLNRIIACVLSGKYQGQSSRPIFAPRSYAITASHPTLIGPRIVRYVLINERVNLPGNGSWLRVKPLFLKVMHSLDHVPRGQTLFTWQELFTNLTTYMLGNVERRKKMFDQRNVFVCECVDTLLGAAFQVRAFHRSQIQHLLLSQLLPLEEP